MPIKAIFSPGQTEITVNGLHQWDYGRRLEIHAPNMPSLVEVHFACLGMSTATVRACSVDFSSSTSKLTAAIPDECLQQTSPVVAWVYYVSATEGETVYTVVMPITARIRPAQAASVPTIITDKYTELIDSINELVERLTDGDVTVANALAADIAQSAQNADRADWADIARNAQSADRAEWAELAEDANHADHAVEADTAKEADKLCLLNYQEYTPNTTLSHGVYMIMDIGTVFLIDSRAEYSQTYYGPDGTAISGTMFRMGTIEKNGGIWLQRYSRTGTGGDERWSVDNGVDGVSGVDPVIKYCRIATYPVG